MKNEKKICPLAKNANVHLQKILKAKCKESGPDKWDQPTSQGDKKLYT